MKRLIFFTLLLCVASANALGGVITLVPATDLNALGSGFVPATSTLTTPMSAGLLNTEVYSQAFVDNTGKYAYLYQVNNLGTTADHPVEMFTLFPFSSELQVGFLNSTANLPATFLSGGQVPESTGSESPGLLESFYYGIRPGNQIVPGNHSLVMYITSLDKPGNITGNVIDGAVGSGTVAGAVESDGQIPEPSVLVLLASCGLGVWVFKCYWK